MHRKCIVALAFVLATVPQATAQVLTANMPPQTGTFNGNVRGYWFTAPSDFVMTGVQVLQQTGSTAAFQNFAVLRFTGGTPPPNFPATTNAFSQLALAFDQPAGAFSPVNIPITAGEVIGMYGTTTVAMSGTPGLNSYGNGSLGTTIFGTPVTLNRSGMQFQLNAISSPGGMHDVFGEPASLNITRIEFQYTAIPEPSSMILASLGLISGLTPRGRRWIHGATKRLWNRV